MATLRKKLLLSAVLTAIAGTANAQIDLPGETGTIWDYTPNERYVIRYKGNGKANVMSEIAKGKGVVKTQSENQRFVAAILPKTHARSMKGNPNIESIEVDPKRYLMAEETPYGIGMVQANQLSDAGTGNQTICIMDTGYDRQHVDLQAVRVTGNNNNRTGNWYNDGDGHGTHVAGTIAALGGNGEGVVGVIPGNKLNLHIIKVFNNNGEWAYGSDLALAVDQCINAGATVISMSLGGEGSSTAEDAAFEKARNNGIISIAAAGNDGITAYNYPASYDSVMSVAAVNSAGSRPNWSQFNDQVEISAPGVNVKSTVPNNQYDTFSGTSMATPHVAGVAALVWSHYPTCSNEQIRSALNASAEDKGTAGRDNKFGFGIVKAKAAYDLLAGGCDAGGGNNGGGGSGGGGATNPGTALENGVAKTGLSGAQGDRFRFSIDVPAGATALNFKLTGGTGDADLYVRAGSKPTLSAYDCRPYEANSNETCTFATPQTTTYHVLINGYSAFNNLNLVASFDDGGGNGANQAPVAKWWSRCDGLSCYFNGTRSADADGTIASYFWKFETGATARGSEANYRFSRAGTYRVLLSVKDNDGERGVKWRNVSVTNTSTAGVNVSAISGGDEDPSNVDLNWNGLEGDEVDIYLNGYLADFTKNDGNWSDRHFEGTLGTQKYKVCEYGSDTKCSNEIKLKFE